MTKKRGLGGNRGLDALLANIRVGRQVAQTVQMAEQSELASMSDEVVSINEEQDLAEPDCVSSDDSADVSQILCQSDEPDGQPDTKTHSTTTQQDDVSADNSSQFVPNVYLDNAQWQQIELFWQYGFGDMAVKSNLQTMNDNG
ncbi:hypothetical protein [Moraxella nasicaprae]|uniref:Uncharacterized protein n=1 Tax=Moraxella nasicaprae TaxID=2904122 RepID=A0ABY6F5B8_9GAMM|nr:hypothetical protein [Moraxella nasicaprae]UXZ05292.1 hypothetical protein LU297_02240 [Moraxella nasicaprae]